MSWNDRIATLSGPISELDEYTSLYRYDKPNIYGSEVFVKQIQCQDEEEAENAERGAEFACHHPHQNICECLDWVREVNPAGGYFVYIFSPPLPNDMYKEVDVRSRERRFYSEEELMQVFNQLFTVLLYLQDQGMAHRDIKPDNIYFYPDGCVKVGNFGFARHYNQPGPVLNTVIGTELYKSPKLRVSSIVTRSSHVEHDAFKSDVYSLGAVFLHLSLLEQPRDLITLKNIGKSIAAYIGKLRYSEGWKKLLTEMMQVEEEARPSFKDLQVMLRRSEAAPALNQVSHRRPVAIACVIDQSGSMTDNFPLCLLKEGLHRLVRTLSDCDRLGLVGFSDSAWSICELTPCNSQGKTVITEGIKSLHGRDLTNILAGFRKGLDLFASLSDPLPTCILLLFTDGKDSFTESSPSTYLSLLQSSPTQPQVCCVGLGELKELNTFREVTQRGGVFAQVTQWKDLVTVFAESVTTIINRS